MRRIIIDCDPGNGIPGANTDDGLAIALAVASPEIQLEMVTTVTGNTPSYLGASVVKKLFQDLHLDIPVYQGAKQALVEDPAPWRARLDHQAATSGLLDLWQGFPSVPQLAADHGDAVDKLIECVRQHPGEITLVAIGPLTNIALAMQRDKQFAELLSEIVIMGGVFSLPQYLKDTNFGLDPEAAEYVLNSGAKITLVPMDVTVNTLLTHHDLSLLTQISHPLTDFIRHTLTPWIDFSMQVRGLPGSWIHDVLTVAWLIDPAIVTSDRYRMGVELASPITRGSSWRYQPPLRVPVGIPENAGAEVTILTGVDNQRLLGVIAHAFCQLAESQ